MRKILVAIIFLPSLLSAQTADNDFKYLTRQETVVIKDKKGQLEIYADVLEEAEFIGAGKLFMANKSIHFDKFKTLENLQAYTFLPESNEKKVVDHFEVKDEIDGIMFYSDNKIKEFTFPAVRKNAITTASYREVYSNEIPFSYLFTFGSYFQTDESTLVLEFPKSVEIGYTMFNTDDISVDFNKKESNKGYVYTWSAKNVNGYPIQDSDDYEARLYYYPHIVVYLKNHQVKGDKKPILNNPADLYSWYTTLIDQIKDENIEEVQQLAEDITADLTSPRDKAAAIYNWVQDNINYVAFGDGFGGFIPRGSASVCSKKYGDCKDMSHVIFVMLNHVGIDAYHTWLGSRNKPYTYNENPTPLVDDHMITAAVIDGDTVFIDGTDGYVPFGYPSGFIQGKEALIGISNDNFEIIKVPVMKAEESKVIVTTTLKLDGSNVLASEKRVLDGFEKARFITKYTFEKDNETPEEYLNNLLELGNNKTNYDNILIEGLDNDHNELSLSYDLNIQNYSRTIGDEIYINMNIDKSFSKDKIDIEKRTFSKKFDHKSKRIFETKLTIPDGYELGAIPDELSFEDPRFGFDISYEVSGDTITQSKEIIINTLSLKKESFVDWNAFIKSLVKAYKKSVVLKKISK